MSASEILRTKADKIRIWLLLSAMLVVAGLSGVTAFADDIAAGDSFDTAPVINVGDEVQLTGMTQQNKEYFVQFTTAKAGVLEYSLTQSDFLANEKGLTHTLYDANKNPIRKYSAVSKVTSIRKFPLNR